MARKSTESQESQVTAPPERINRSEVMRLRTAAAAPKRITRKFFLDSPLGEVEVIVKGPSGAARLNATHETLHITTGDGDAPAVPVTRRGTTERQVASAGRRMSGDPTQPSETIEASLPGDDDVAEEKARELEGSIFEFLRAGEKALMRRDMGE